MTLPDGAQSGTRKDLANYRLQCAEQELKDTQLLIHAESFNSANNLLTMLSFMQSMRFMR